jgi:rhodanese-related sulfurtransferase
MTDVKTLTPAELAQRLARGDDLLLLDVREPHELEICRIENSFAMPMSEISSRLSELDPDKPTVCICHHGIRSAHVASALARMDFTEVYNLAGGVDRWAVEVDTSMTRYGR